MTSTVEHLKKYVQHSTNEKKSSFINFVIKYGFIKKIMNDFEKMCLVYR